MKKTVLATKITTATTKTAKKITVGIVLKKVWQVIKGVSIATSILTIISLCYEMAQPGSCISKYAYPYNTQDYEDLKEAVKKMPNSAEYKKMLKEFNTKYGISYKTSLTYTELVRLRKEKPDSEEYKQTLAKLLEEFDIAPENITFDE